VPTIEDLILADPGLLFYYPFDDASNPGTVADLSPNGHDLTVYNDEAALPAGNPLQFGVAGPSTEVPRAMFMTRHVSESATVGRDWCARPEASSGVYVQQPYDADFTFFCAVNRIIAPFDYTNMDIFTVATWSSGSSLRLVINDSGATHEATIYGFSSTALSTGINFKNAGWHTIAFTWSRAASTYGTLTLYVDGVETDSKVFGTWVTSKSTAQHYIGLGGYPTYNPIDAAGDQPGWYTKLTGSLCQTFASWTLWSQAEILALSNRVLGV
jgi:hypothetical protein